MITGFNVARAGTRLRVATTYSIIQPSTTSSHCVAITASTYILMQSTHYVRHH